MKISFLYFIFFSHLFCGTSLKNKVSPTVDFIIQCIEKPNDAVEHFNNQISLYSDENIEQYIASALKQNIDRDSINASIIGVYNIDIIKNNDYNEMKYFFPGIPNRMNVDIPPIRLYFTAKSQMPTYLSRFKKEIIDLYIYKFILDKFMTKKIFALYSIIIILAWHFSILIIIIITLILLTILTAILTAIFFKKYNIKNTDKNPKIIKIVILELLEKYLPKLEKGKTKFPYMSQSQTNDYLTERSDLLSNIDQLYKQHIKQPNLSA